MKKIILILLILIIPFSFAFINEVNNYDINCYTTQNDGNDIYCLKKNYIEVYNNQKQLIRNITDFDASLTYAGLEEPFSKHNYINQIKTGYTNLITSEAYKQFNINGNLFDIPIIYIGAFNGITQSYKLIYNYSPIFPSLNFFSFKGGFIDNNRFYVGYYITGQSINPRYSLHYINYSDFSGLNITLIENPTNHGAILKTNRINDDTRIYLIREINRTDMNTYNLIPFNYKNGWYKSNNTDFIITKTDNYIYYYNNRTTLFNDDGVNLFNLFINCNNIKTLSNLNIIDIDCNNENDCLVGVNYETNKYILFHLSKSAGCNDITLLNNTAITQIRYNENNNRFYVALNNKLKVYSTTPFTNETTTNPICVDNNYLCNNPIYVNNFYYCNIDDIIYCSNGCINNSCAISTCNNECFFEGQGYVNILDYTGCINQFQFATCGNYDNDECLELSTPNICIQGTYCNINTCTPLNTNIETLQYPSFVLNPILDNNSYYDTINKIVVNNNPNILVSQRFSINTNNPSNKYYALNCDYKNNLISNNSNSFNINMNKYYEITISNPKNNISIIKDLNNDSIIINNDSIYFNLLKVFDINAEINYFKLLIYNNNLEFMIELNDLSKSKYYTKPIYLENIYSIETNDNMSIYEFNEMSGFKKIVSNELFCSYNNNGCYTIRTYLSNYNYGLLNSKDLKICVNNIGTANNIISNDFFNFGIFGQNGLLIGIAIIAISILFIFIAGYRVGINNSILSILSIIISILFIGYFSIIGVFPLWLIIILIIIVGFIGVFSFRKIFIGD